MAALKVSGCISTGTYHPSLRERKSVNKNDDNGDVRWFVRFTFTKNVPAALQICQNLLGRNERYERPPLYVSIKLHYCQDCKINIDPFVEYLTLLRINFILFLWQRENSICGLS